MPMQTSKYPATYAPTSCCLRLNYSCVKKCIQKQRKYTQNADKECMLLLDPITTYVHNTL